MKLLVIASAGGHWVQLQRLLPAFEQYDISFMSTNGKLRDTIGERPFFLIRDANRWNKWKLIKSFVEVFYIVTKLRPDAIVTTGAAPGLMGIIAGRFWGCKTVWVDSIANVEKLSMSGKIARRFADRVYTQWPHLAAENLIYYNGNVLA
ncbi:Oligosaccharide biosynthesis protein Alg14 like [Filimonas lacunae]|uniref:Oligosaccharide biosynthesis protein Alg14 like n=1 Tax=Filimonas lacunae TaxID=477680 RepID=A0A173MN92_9BACT|nr:oligosaccharide biosynthesis protein Alg14 [Filimonas lacunae]BAV09125.1 UDP-N-acetylglucosamine:LPS N-acetylglucosamine transferase [Filimonas lacunae]SIS67605.1 Oligosaccharide biosynthesis protein Alg14 like [Filimonas lacunae]